MAPLTYVYFIYLVLEGAFRKWLFPDWSNELFLAKDLVLLVAFVLLAWRLLLGRRALPTGMAKEERLIWVGWVVLFLAYFMASGFSLTGVVGLRYYLILLPILILLPAVLMDVQHLNRAAKVYLAIAIAVGIVGVIQFNSPPDALINAYAWSATELSVATFGEGSDAATRARITGTFSYITPYTYFLQFVLFIAWALLILSKTVKEKWLAIIGLTVVVTNIVMSGSRAPLIVAMLFSIPFAYLALQDASRRGRALGVVVVVTLIASGSLYLSWEALGAVLSRNEEAQDTAERVAGALLMPWHTLMDAEPFGIGLGATFMGLGELYGDGNYEFRFDEIKHDRLGIETGIPGYAYALFVKTFLVLRTWALYRRIVFTELKVWSLVSLCYQASLLWTIPVYQSVGFAYYLVSIGLYIWIKRQAALMQTGRNNVAARG